MNQLVKIQKKSLVISMIIVVLLQLSLVFQGFDVCDDGFVLTFYQQIFTNPESVEYNFLYWFAGIIGGVWHKFYEDGGILWFRFLAIIVNTSTFYITYRLLKPHMNTIFLFLALIMALFVNDYGFLTFYHNQLTALMAVLIIYVLQKAIIHNNFSLYILSGILLSINVFTRIPNLVLFSFILVIPFAYYLRKESMVKALKPMFFLGLGAIAGFVIVYATLLSLGQVEIMKNAIYTISDLGKTENSSHNFKSIFSAPLYNYKGIVLETFKLIVITGVLYLVYGVMPTSKIKQTLLFISSVSLFIYWFNNSHIYSIYSMCLIGSTILIFSKKVELRLKVIALLSLLSLVTISLGSAGGIKNSGFMAIWIGLPLFFYVLNHYGTVLSDLRNSFINLKLPLSAIVLFSYSIVTAFYVLKVYRIPQQSYFDSGSRFEKIYAIDNTLANGIYTTKRRANIINDLLRNLDEYVEPNDYLMVYDKVPMIHFLTKTKPYMYNPWVWIYDYNSFEKKLHKAEREIADLPIVVQQKFETVYEFSEPITDYMSSQKENNNLHSNERNSIMKAFLQRNNYEIVWSNRYFNIFKTNKLINKVN